MTAGEVFAAFAQQWNAGDDFARLAADGRIVLLVSFDGTAESPRASGDPARPA